MTRVRELSEAEVAALLAEYREVCDELKYQLGTSLRILLRHQWCQGAQVAALKTRLPVQVSGKDPDL